MSAVILQLPLTSVMLATLLLGSDGPALTPLAIVAVAVAYIASLWLAGSPQPETQPQTQPEGHAAAVPAAPSPRRTAGP
jgi:hypothetical protein